MRQHPDDAWRRSASVGVAARIEYLADSGFDRNEIEIRIIDELKASGDESVDRVRLIRLIEHHA